MNKPQDQPPRDSAPNDATSSYLWDRSGTPDPAVQQLENALAPLRHRAPAPAAQTAAPRPLRSLAVAAMLVLCTGLLWYIQRPAPPSWEVTALEGAPTVDSARVGNSSRLARNDWLETDASSRASLAVANIGSVTVEPGSKVRLIESNEKHHRMQLAKGTIGAFINAPPRLFFVDTPSAQAIDMGCIYTLTVADDGSSELKTTFGLVELARTVSGRDIVSKVPSGALCRTDLTRGPGTPRFEDAPEPLIRALDEFDLGKPNTVTTVTRSSRLRDTLTLWHLLERTTGNDRRAVFDTLVALAGRPADASDEATLAINAGAMSAWWSYLQTKW